MNAPQPTLSPFRGQVEYLPPDALVPYGGNARTHSTRQIAQIADSIRRFGFTNPVLASDDGQVIAGHGRLMAARQLGLSEIPVIRLSHLSPTERRAYVLADNKLAEKAGWDQDLLAIELQGLIDLGFDLELTGFELAEIDLVLDTAGPANSAHTRDATAGELPAALPGPPVTQHGDLWLLGPHRLLRGDARSVEDMARLCESAASTCSLLIRPIMSP